MSIRCSFASKSGIFPLLPLYHTHHQPVNPAGAELQFEVAGGHAETDQPVVQLARPLPAGVAAGVVDDDGDVVVLREPAQGFADCRERRDVVAVGVLRPLGARYHLLVDVQGRGRRGAYA